MTVTQVRLLIHTAASDVEVAVLLRHVLRESDIQDKRLLLEILLEDSASFSVSEDSNASEKLKNTKLAIGLLQSSGLR